MSSSIGLSFYLKFGNSSKHFLQALIEFSLNGVMGIIEVNSEGFFVLCQKGDEFCFLFAAVIFQFFSSSFFVAFF